MPDLDQKEIDRRAKKAAYMRAYYAKKGRKRNLEQGRQYNAKYRAENPEKVRAQVQNWRERNPDKVKEYSERTRQEAYQKYKAKKLAEDPDFFKKRHQKIMTTPGGEQKRAEYSLKNVLKTRYGLTVEQYRAMHAAQDGKCAICLEEEKSQHEGKTRRLSVDHDHVSGDVRDLLCHRCNKALGMFRESKSILMLAIKYLEKHEKRLLESLNTEGQ